MITISSKKLERLARMPRNQGMERRHKNKVVGFNARTTDIRASIGRVQLGKLADWTEKWQANATFLNEQVKSVVTPPNAPGAMLVNHQHTVRVIDHDQDAVAKADAR